MFLKLISPPAIHLAEKIYHYEEEGNRIYGQQDVDEEDMNYFEKTDDPVAEIAARMSSTNWYPNSSEKEACDYDSLLSLIFHSNLFDDKELDSELLGEGITNRVYGLLLRITPDDEKGYSFLQKVSRWFKGRSQESRLARSAIDQMGCRPFRDPHNQHLKYKEYLSCYSIHDPDEVKLIYGEAVRYENGVSALEGKDDMVDEYITSFLESFEVAARNNLAIFAYHSR